MNYQWHYNRLIETRRDRILDPFEHYENHHIVLKSMGGGDEEENIIRLTAREHFIAHWLLWRIHRNRQTSFAFYSFINFFQGHNHQKRPKITSSRGYQEARESHNIFHSERMIGTSLRSRKVLQYSLDGNFIREWNSAKETGICHVSDCCRGERRWAGGYIWKYKDDFVIKSKPYKKRTFTTKRKRSLNEENRKRISESVLGRKWYNDGKRNIFLMPFDSNDGLILGRLPLKKRESLAKVKCPYCEKIGAYTLMKRWHFDKCKFKVK